MLSWGATTVTSAGDWITTKSLSDRPLQAREDALSRQGESGCKKRARDARALSSELFVLATASPAR